MLNSSEIKQTVETLRKLEPGYYPIEIFWEFCRLNKLTTIELAIFKKYKDKNPKVLLIKRPKDDKFWPGLYHNPGCIIRSTDSLDDALNRVLTQELNNPDLTIKPQFIKSYFSKFIERGNIIAMQYWAEANNTSVGEFIEYNRIKQMKNMVNGTLENIEASIESYNEYYHIL